MNANNVCVECLTDGDCDDNNFCNIADTCDAATACVPGGRGSRNCDDGNVDCTDDSCDEANDGLS